MMLYTMGLWCFCLVLVMLGLMLLVDELFINLY